MRLWDGQEVSWNQERDFTIVFTDVETFRICCLSRDPAQFAEAYADGRMLVEGDLWSAIGIARYLRTLELSLPDRLRFIPRLVARSSPHTVKRDRKDIQAHYDLSDEFFRIFLDEKMVYSCAYFADSSQSLELAQERKLDLICRKLALSAGERFLDVGCGWGALLIWAARHYGVRARGITLSENQATEARRRASIAGVGDRVTIELRHYTDLPESSFDKISSIGMCEHVGAAKLPSYMNSVHRALRPGGAFLNHGITQPREVGPGGGAFIFRHVFPGAELLDVSGIQDEMQRVGFEVTDVQSLRRHYALTLREWFRRFTANRSAAASHVSEKVLRIWDLYLAGCAHAFEDGLINIHQVLAAKPDKYGRTHSHLTREDMLLDSALGSPAVSLPGSPV